MNKRPGPLKSSYQTKEEQVKVNNNKNKICYGKKNIFRDLKKNKERNK